MSSNNTDAELEKKIQHTIGYCPPYTSKRECQHSDKFLSDEDREELANIMALIQADRQAQKEQCEQCLRGKKATNDRMPITKAELARYLGISRPTLNLWLEDPGKMTLKAVKQLAALQREKGTK